MSLVIELSFPALCKADSFHIYLRHLHEALPSWATESLPVAITTSLLMGHGSSTTVQLQACWVINIS